MIVDYLSSNYEIIKLKKDQNLNIYGAREFKNSLYLGDTEWFGYCRPRSSTEVKSRIIDTDGYGACMRADTDFYYMYGEIGQYTKY